MPPRISVIVPIYNAASTLRAAVQSILTQDIAGLEVLLVDDGSTDAGSHCQKHHVGTPPPCTIFRFPQPHQVGVISNDYR